MGKKQEYKQQNKDFIARLKEEDIIELFGGLLYRQIQQGDGKEKPSKNSIVTCHYCGKLIDGSIFDDTRQRNVPEAFRVNELIDGFQVALCNMCKGEKGIAYIPYQLGYGNKRMGNIPAFSTLVFEIEIVDIV